MTKTFTPAWRNVYYDSKNQEMYLWTWDAQGNKVLEKESFYPYLFIENEQGTDGFGIGPGTIGKRLSIKKFRTAFDRNQYFENHPTGRVYFNLPPEQQFLIEKFGDQNLSNPPPLDLIWLDIETWSPDEFPEPSEAKHLINLITVWRNNKFFTWASPRNKSAKFVIPKNFEEEIIYKSFNSEKEMLRNFIDWWASDYPDAVAGWNTIGFDFPYLFNRIKNLFGEKILQKLSPVGVAFFQERVPGRVPILKSAQGKHFNKDLSRWSIKGVQLLDYMDIYKGFSFSPRESYSLDHISEVELGKNKIKFETSNLSEIATKDWQTYVEYNIQDVRLLVELDKKLKFIDIVRFICYMGFISFEKALGKVSPITGAIANEARKNGFYISTYRKTFSGQKSFVGGYVKEPVRGLIPSVVVYDANSLYPNTMITLNISPETKVGRIVEKNEDGSVVIYLDNENSTKRLSEEKFRKFLQAFSLSCSAAGVLYSQSYKGIIPLFVDKLYDRRVQIQKEMKQTSDSAQRESLNLLQIAVKIFLNSIYGALGQESFYFYDTEHSSSITLSGQEVIKQAAQIAHQFLERKTNRILSPDQTIIYGDTDSVHLSLQTLYPEGLFEEGVDEKGNKTKKPREGVADLLKELNQELDTQLEKWARSYFFSLDPRFKMKQESVCDRALYLEKKHYILRTQDMEGEGKIDKYKYVGVEVSKASYAKSVRKIIENFVKVLFDVHHTNEKLNDLLYQSYKEFQQLPEVDLAVRMSISDLNKYQNSMEGWKVGTGTPGHVKGALYYNKLLEELGLQSKYELIKSGMKIKFCYLNLNPKKLDVLSFPSIYPKEFIEAGYTLNKEKMYMKTVHSALERFFTVLNKRLIDPTQFPTEDLTQFLE